jgi:hypothetical protein
MKSSITTDRPVRRAAKPQSAKGTEATVVRSAQALPPGPGGKLGVLIDLLRRTQGATLADMMEATGWQGHSVRGAMAGSIKKKLCLAVVSSKDGNVRTWRIADASS